MKRNSLRNLIASSTVVSGLALAQSAKAVPVTAGYFEDSRCDNIPNQTLTHEIGRNFTFPINEALQISVSAATGNICSAPDGIQNEWTVQITNVSGVAWQDLFFNGNLGTFVGNADGSMIDVVNAPGVTTDAFRIDGTVTLGVNNSLVSESGVVDEILSPGETWRFRVDNFRGGPGVPVLTPQFRTPGQFAGSAPLITTLPPDNASILANPVPEPSLISAIGIVAGALLMRRPKRN